MELLLTTTTRKQSRSGATVIYKTFCFRTQFFLSTSLDQDISKRKNESYTNQGLFRRENPFFVTARFLWLNPQKMQISRLLTTSTKSSISWSELMNLHEMSILTWTLFSVFSTHFQ